MKSALVSCLAVCISKKVPCYAGGPLSLALTHATFKEVMNEVEGGGGEGEEREGGEKLDFLLRLLCLSRPQSKKRFLTHWELRCPRIALPRPGHSQLRRLNPASVRRLELAAAASRDECDVSAFSNLLALKLTVAKRGDVRYGSVGGDVVAAEVDVVALTV